MKRDFKNNSDNQSPTDTAKGPLFEAPAELPENDGGFLLSLELMTESELIQFLRVPQISSSKDFHNVIEHLKRVRHLPCIQICNKTLYPKKAILKWIEKETSG